MTAIITDDIVTATALLILSSVQLMGFTVSVTELGVVVSQMVIVVVICKKIIITIDSTKSW
jgi:hypothetical protein